LMLSFMMGLIKRKVYHIACSAQAANSIPAMAPSAEARANQSRQKGGCGVFMSSPPSPPAIRLCDHSGSRVSQYVDRHSIGSAYAFQHRSRAEKGVTGVAEIY